MELESITKSLEGGNLYAAAGRVTTAPQTKSEYFRILSNSMLNTSVKTALDTIYERITEKARVGVFSLSHSVKHPYTADNIFEEIIKSLTNEGFRVERTSGPRQEASINIKITW